MIAVLGERTIRKSGEMADTDKCFARIERGGVWKCAVITTGVCMGRACPFYKSTEQVKQEAEQTQARLRSLPEEKRRAIQEKYKIFF